MYPSASAVGGLYTMVLNLLNFPAGILTVDRETEEDQAALESYPTPCVELKWFKEVSGVRPPAVAMVQTEVEPIVFSGECCMGN